MRHKLTPEQKEQIRAMKARGEKLEYLAALFSVSRPTVEYHCYARLRQARLRRQRERRAA